MFTVALFIIAKRWRQPKCPSAGKWANERVISTQWNITWPRRSEGQMQIMLQHDESSKYFAKCKELVTKCHKLYDSSLMTCPG